MSDNKLDNQSKDLIRAKVEAVIFASEEPLHP